MILRKVNYLKLMLKSKKNVVLICLIFFILPVKSQTFSIIKDSVLINSTYFVLEDFKINSNNKNATNNIYKIIQKTYNIFDKSLICEPNIRLKIKKDSLSNYVLNNKLNETNFGFEHYEVYFNKNGILNLSINIQSYGSPFEFQTIYCFDLNTGKKIESNLFINLKVLLKKCKTKLKENNNSISIKNSDLSNFEITTDIDNNFTELNFIIFDKQYRNSGYQKHIIHFKRKEIEKYISPVFKDRLMNVKVP